MIGDTSRLLRYHTVMQCNHSVPPYCVFQAMVFVMPLLGMGYLVTLIPPDKEESMAAYQVFSLARSLLLSTQVSSHHTGIWGGFILCQGLMISITYCFVNDEVQTVVMTHWRRRMLVRRVGRERKSVARPVELQDSCYEQTLCTS